jgi:hypothetical protein
MKIKLRVKRSDGSEGFVEQDGHPVPDTDGLFAVRVEDQDEDEDVGVAPDNSGPPADSLPRAWVPTHLPTGYALGRFARRADAVWYTQALFRAAPTAWAQPDLDAVVKALPRPVAEWASLARAAAALGVSPLLLKTPEEFARVRP